MARFSNGWIKIYREAIDGDIGEDPFVLGVFVKLVGWSHRREGDAKLAGQRVKLDPGQVATGLRELSPNTILDPYLHRVRTALGYLEKRGTITQTTSNQGRIITICNWEKYQSFESSDSKQDASDEQAERKLGANEAQHIGVLRKKKEELERALPGIRAFLDAAYGIYPRHEGKTRGFKKLEKEIKTEADREALLAAIEKYKRSKSVKDGFVKLFSTFAGEWRDWLDADAGQVNGRPPPPLKQLADLEREELSHAT